MNWLAKLFDSSDKTVEAHLVLTAICILSFIGLTIYAVVVLGHPFDPQAYGTGAGATFAGTGAAAWGTGLQRKNEG